MTIEALKKFQRSFKIYSILGFLIVLATVITLGILMNMYTGKTGDILIILFVLFVVILSVLLEVMLEALTIKIRTYNNGIYTIYAGVFNHYLFKEDKIINERYDLKLFKSIIMRYVTKENDLIELNISPVIKRLTFKINDEIIKED